MTIEPSQSFLYQMVLIGNPFYEYSKTGHHVKSDTEDLQRLEVFWNNLVPSSFLRDLRKYAWSLYTCEMLSWKMIVYLALLHRVQSNIYCPTPSQGCHNYILMGAMGQGWENSKFCNNYSMGSTWGRILNLPPTYYMIKRRKKRKKK